MADVVSVIDEGDGVATIRLDRPPVNAIDEDLWTALAAATRQVATDDAVAAVVVTGGPKVFAAGADIKAMRVASFQEFSARAEDLQATFAAVARVPKIVVAAVAGYALGAGCELAMCADFRIAADNAKLGQPEILLGIIPGAGGTQRLQRLVGVQHTKRMVYGGQMVSAHEALDMGLVDEVCPADHLHDSAVAMAKRYARGPFALRMAKQAIDEGAEMDLDAALRLESHLFMQTFATEDRRIGMDSFVENGPGKAEFTRR